MHYTFHSSKNRTSRVLCRNVARTYSDPQYSTVYTVLYNVTVIRVYQSKTTYTSRHFGKLNRIWPRNNPIVLTSMNSLFQFSILSALSGTVLNQRWMLSWTALNQSRALIQALLRVWLAVLFASSTPQCSYVLVVCWSESWQVFHSVGLHGHLGKFLLNFTFTLVDLSVDMPVHFWIVHRRFSALGTETMALIRSTYRPYAALTAQEVVGSHRLLRTREWSM